MNDCGVHNMLQIVKNYLIENGFDGLYNLVVPCGCKIDDLGACNCSLLDCRPGYLHYGEHGWKIGPQIQRYRCNRCDHKWEGKKEVCPTCGSDDFGVTND